MLNPLLSLAYYLVAWCFGFLGLLAFNHLYSRLIPNGRQLLQLRRNTISFRQPKIYASTLPVLVNGVPAPGWVFLTADKPHFTLVGLLIVPDSCALFDSNDIYFRKLRF